MKNYTAIPNETINKTIFVVEEESNLEDNAYFVYDYFKGGSTKIAFHFDTKNKYSRDNNHKVRGILNAYLDKYNGEDIFVLVNNIRTILSDYDENTFDLTLRTEKSASCVRFEKGLFASGEIFLDALSEKVNIVQGDKGLELSYSNNNMNIKNEESADTLFNSLRLHINKIIRLSNMSMNSEEKPKINKLQG